MNDAEDFFHAVITESIKSYEHNKQAAVWIYKQFLCYLKEEHKLQISSYFLDEVPATSLERQLKIVKLMHDPQMWVNMLPDRLLTSDKTVEGDLKRLKGDDDDTLSVMGQTLRVEYERDGNKIHYPSTVHPLFLTFNLTQVMVMLEGLEQMAQNKMYEAYAVNAARNIWLQLSDYARNRLFTVLEQLGKNLDWYQQLDGKSSGHMFYSEHMCSSSEGQQGLMLCFKNDQPCFIEYCDENGQVIYFENCRIVNLSREYVKIETDGKLHELKSDRILKSSDTIFGLC